MSWDTFIAIVIVAVSAVYVGRRLFRKPHCGAEAGCKTCADARNTSGSTQHHAASAPRDPL